MLSALIVVAVHRMRMSKREREKGNTCAIVTGSNANSVTSYVGNDFIECDTTEIQVYRNTKFILIHSLASLCGVWFMVIFIIYLPDENKNKTKK